MQGVQIVGRQIQRIRQGAGSGLLRALLGQQAGQLNVGVFLTHLQPNPTLLTRVVHSRNFVSRLLRERCHQVLVHRHAGDQRGRHRNADVVLGQEGFQHLHLDRHLGLPFFFNRL